MANYYSLQQLVTDLESLLKINPDAKVNFSFQKEYRRVTYPDSDRQSIVDAAEKDFNMIYLRKCDSTPVSELIPVIQDLAKKAEGHGPILLSMEFGMQTLPLEGLTTVTTVKSLDKYYKELTHNPHHAISKALEEAKPETLDDIVKVIEKQCGNGLKMTLYHVENKWFSDLLSLIKAYPCFDRANNWESAFTKETRGSITIMTSRLIATEFEEIFRSPSDRLDALLAQKDRLETTTDANGNTVTKKYGPGHVLLDEITTSSTEITTRKYGPNGITAVETVFSDGWKKAEPYVNGKIEGTVITYLETGNEKSRLEFKDGKKNGNYSYYHPDGKLQGKGQYVNGKEEGIWEDYDQKGTLELRTLYAQGVQKDFYFAPLKVDSFRDSLLKVQNTQLLVERISSGLLVLVGVDKDGKVTDPTKEDEAQARLRDIKTVMRE